MNPKRRTLAVALVGVMLLSGVATAGAVSSAAANTTGDSLGVAVEQADDGSATVTVTRNGSAVENANVTVGVTDDNVTYAGAGDYATDDNGTVELPEPAENVTVEVTAEDGNATGSTTAELTASEADEENGSFGQLVSSFVQEMLNAGDDGGPIGQAVSEYVTENNPGNADENRPDDAGKPANASESGDESKPDNAGPHDGDKNSTDDDDTQGPPENAGNDDGDSDDGDSEAGNGNAKGNGK
jgi:hypothetical protein